MMQPSTKKVDATQERNEEMSENSRFPLAGVSRVSDVSDKTYYRPTRVRAYKG